MSSLTLKQIPEDVLVRLRHRARRNGRSLNRELLVCLQRIAVEEPLDTEALLARLADLRLRPRTPLDDVALRRDRDEGRL